jgi:putative endopeptidase
MRGVDKMLPRWKRVLATTNTYLGEAIGKLYVDENFPPEAKAKPWRWLKISSVHLLNV